MGKRWRYIYKLYNKDGELVEQGTQTEILDHHYTSSNNLYDCWKKGLKFMREYKVERVRKEWKPEQNEEYWYCAIHGVFKDYFNTNSFLCLLRFFAKNCYRTRDEAIANADELYYKLLNFYKNS